MNCPSHLHHRWLLQELPCRREEVLDLLVADEAVVDGGEEVVRSSGSYDDGMMMKGEHDANLTVQDVVVDTAVAGANDDYDDDLMMTLMLRHQEHWYQH